MSIVYGAGPTPTDDWFAQWQNPSPSSGLPGPSAPGLPPNNMGMVGPGFFPSQNLPTATGYPGPGQLPGGMPAPPSGYPNTGVTGGFPPGQMPGTTTPTGAAGGAGNPDAFRAAWFASGGKTVDDLKAFVAAHPEFGATITGSKGSKIVFPNGQAYQAVRSAGLGGGIGPAWDDLSGAAGGGTLAGVNGGGVIPPNLLSPYGTAYGNPSMADLEADPGYQARLKSGTDAIQTSAAARGTLLSGGTLKGLNRFAQDFASNEYQNLWSRNYANNTGNYNIFTGNQNGPFNKLSDLAKIGFPA